MIAASGRRALRAKLRGPRQHIPARSPPETGLRSRYGADRDRAIRRRRAPYRESVRVLRRQQTPKSQSRASSFSEVATPPRVGSRIQRMPGRRDPARASTSGSTDRVSEQSSAFEIEFAAREQNGDAMIADGPAEQHLVAGTNRCGETVRPGIEPADSRSGDVHAVGFAVLDNFCIAADDRRRPALAAAFAMARTSASRISVGSPASSTYVTTRASALAPETARSFTVPLTASSPIDPPGKLSGLTTKLSVVMAIRVPLMLR